jgi:hypothetical protein
MTPAEASYLFGDISFTPKPMPPNGRKLSIEESLFGEDVDVAAELNDEMRLELQELERAVHGPPLPTTLCVQQFKKVAVRKLEPNIKRRREEDLVQAKAQRDIHIATLDQLRKWAEWKKNEKNVIGRLQHAFRFRPKPPLKEDIIKMAKHYYPMRADVILNVCDFGKTSFKRTKVRFAEIEDCMYISAFLMLSANRVQGWFLSLTMSSFAGCMSLQTPFLCHILN